MKRNILLFLTLFASNLSFSQWIEININAVETLNQIYFVNDTIGFIVGNNGQLFRTADGGENWLQINAGTSQNLFTISFANNSIGFVNGLKTMDGGISWSSQTASEEFGLLHALDENNLIAGLANSFSGDIYKSSDGGDSWEIIANPVFPSSGAYHDVCFVNDELGYLSAWYSGHLVRTIDGGNNWTEIVIDVVDGASFSSDDFKSVDFPTEEVGLVTHERGILKTIDSGNTWSEIKPEWLNTSFYPESITALSTENYIVVGGFAGVEFEKIYETSDGGATWIQSVSTTDAFFDLSCTTINCFAVGTNGKIYKKETLINTISESKERSALRIYPNPSKDILNIETDVNIAEISIFDLEGKRMNSFSEGLNMIDVSHLPAGIYLINVSSKERIYTDKFIKE